MSSPQGSPSRLPASLERLQKEEDDAIQRTQEALEAIQATVKEAELSRATIKRLVDKRDDELSSYKTVAEELAAAKCLAQHFTKVWEGLQEKLNKIGVEVDYVKKAIPRHQHTLFKAGQRVQAAAGRAESALAAAREAQAAFSESRALTLEARERATEAEERARLETVLQGAEDAAREGAQQLEAVAEVVGAAEKLGDEIQEEVPEEVRSRRRGRGEETRGRGEDARAKRSPSPEEGGTPRADVNARAEKLFVESLNEAVSRKSLPFNASVVSDIMRLRDSWWKPARLGTTFTAFLRKMEEQGHIGLQRTVDSILIGKSRHAHGGGARDSRSPERSEKRSRLPRGGKRSRGEHANGRARSASRSRSRSRSPVRRRVVRSVARGGDGSRGGSPERKASLERRRGRSASPPAQRGASRDGREARWAMED